MPEPEDQLRRLAAHRAEQIAPHDRVADPIPTMYRRRPIVLVSIAAAVVVALVAAGFAFWPDDDSRSVHVGTPTTSTPVATTTTASAQPQRSAAGGTVTRLDAGPLSARWGSAAVWANDKLFVFGGQREAINMGLPGGDEHFVDGAVYDPAKTVWTELPKAPIQAEVSTGSRFLGSRFGEDLAFFLGDSGAAWNPTIGTWTRLPDPPAPLVDMIWTGEELVGLGSPSATLRPGDSSWRLLPDPPGTSLRDASHVTAAWTGHEAIVLTRNEPLNAMAADVVATALDPRTQTWRVLPPSGINAQAFGATWTGSRLVVVNYDAHAVAYDPTSNAWRTLADLPVDEGEWVPVLTSVDGDVVAVMYVDVALLPRDTDTWTVRPKWEGLSCCVLSGHDGTLYFFGYDSVTRANTFWTFNP